MIRKHAEKTMGIDLSGEGAASTSKKIISKSVNSLNKMRGFDNVLN